MEITREYLEKKAKDLQAEIDEGKEMQQQVNLKLTLLKGRLWEVHDLLAESYTPKPEEPNEG
jgi:hypothetical protein